VNGVNIEIRLKSGYPIDRRRLLEYFYDAANRLGNIFPDCVADATFLRTDFEIDALSEVWWKDQLTPDFRYPEHSMHTLPGASVEVRTDDSFMEGRLTWSVRASARGPCKAISIVPVINGEAMWQAEDYMQLANLRYLDAGSIRASTVTFLNSSISLGGEANVIVPNGRSMTGLLIWGEGLFNVNHVSLAVRSVMR